MTLIEIGAVFILIIGLTIGAIVGHDQAGTLGGVVGAVLGVVSLVALVELLAALETAVRRSRKRTKLSPTFGRYWRRDRASAWQSVKEQLIPGQSVRGQLVVETRYGKFLDIGVGFPVCIRPWGIQEENSEALVLEFDDANREIVLTYKQLRWLVYESIPIGRLFDNAAMLERREIYYTAVTNAAHARFIEHLRRDGVARCQLSNLDAEPTWIEVRRGERKELRFTPIEAAPIEVDA